MHENDEFSFFIGELVPRAIEAKIRQTLDEHFRETDNGQRLRDYYCPLGRIEGVRVLEELKESLLRESGDRLSFDILRPIPRVNRYTLTNVVIGVK